MNQHFRDSINENRRKTNYFHNAIHKYGKENFSFEEIDSATDCSELDDKERYWIAYYKSNIREYGYNLDSGGQSGGCKSDITKAKIGLTTLKKWEDPEIAEKMLDGLKRGTQTAKERAKENFVDFVCPVCHTPYKMKQWEINGRKTCSLKCAATLNYEQNLKHLQQITQSNYDKTLQRRTEIKEFIIEWCKNNSDIISNCPLNKITTQLQPLILIVEEKYSIKDIRSRMACFDFTSRKKFITYLQNIINN